MDDLNINLQHFHKPETCNLKITCDNNLKKICISNKTKIKNKCSTEDYSFKKTQTIFGRTKFT